MLRQKKELFGTNALLGAALAISMASIPAAAAGADDGQNGDPSFARPRAPFAGS